MVNKRFSIQWRLGRGVPPSPREKGTAGPHLSYCWALVASMVSSENISLCTHSMTGN